MAEQVFKREVDGYYGNTYRDDFRAEDEITVTITLHEYRELVADKAKHAENIRKKDEEIAAMRRERDEAKSVLTALKDRLGINNLDMEGGEE